MQEYRRTWSIFTLAEATGRSARLRLVGLLVCCLTTFAACGNGGEPPITEQHPPGPQSQSQLQTEVPQPQSGDEREREIIVTDKDGGSHVKKYPYEASLPRWLERSEDLTIRSLPGRALRSTGISFSSSAQSPTGEDLWIHVFTDESKAAAVEWVSHVTSIPAEFAKDIAWHQPVFDVRILPLLQVGDASVTIELFRGNNVICIHSILMVFAQDAAIIFLYSSIEVTRSADSPAPSGDERGIPAHCDAAAVENRLTDVDGLAELISDQP